METKEAARKLSELYLALAADQKIQFKAHDGWTDFIPGEHSSPRLNNICHPKWRVKPELTPIDLSVLIESGVDCEFWDHCGYKVFGSIKKYENGLSPYKDFNDHYWHHCTLRKNYLHAWKPEHDSTCPIPGELKVYITLRDGSIHHGYAFDFRWNKDPDDPHTEIIQFEWKGEVEPGYCLPWEVKE